MKKLKVKAAKMYVSITVLMVRNHPSKGENDENPATSEFYILSISGLCKVDEIPDFLEHVKMTVNSRIENTQNQLQGSGWVIRELLKFAIIVCKFVKGVLGNYKAYPPGLRGSHNVINPRSSENCVLIALACSMYLKQNPNVKPSNVITKINRNSRKFWQDRINIGTLNCDSIGWESLSQLEKLNKVSFNVYSLAKQSHNNKKYCIELVHHSRSDYERVNLLLLNDDHVCLIKILKEFYRNFIHRHKPITNLCSRCLTIFDNEDDCKTLQDYVDVYLNLDVAFLTDIYLQ